MTLDVTVYRMSLVVCQKLTKDIRTFNYIKFHKKIKRPTVAILEGRTTTTIPESRTTVTAPKCKTTITVKEDDMVTVMAPEEGTSTSVLMEKSSILSKSHVNFLVLP
jgi:hypothetical protein